MPFSCIVAMDDDRGIGKQGKIPWRFPEDIRHFAEMTTGNPPAGKQNAVIMGRRTWESLPERFRPLPNRVNVVLSRQKGVTLSVGVISEPSLESALDTLSKRQDICDLFVIGGAPVYAEALEHPECCAVLVTRIPYTYDCDVFFPEIPKRFVNTHRVVGFHGQPSFMFFKRVSTDGQ